MQLTNVCDQVISLVLPPYGGTNEKKPLKELEQLSALEQKAIKWDRKVSSYIS